MKQRSENMIHAKLFDSLELITPEGGSSAPELKRWTICKNEPFSFQLAYKILDGPDAEKTPDELHFNIQVAGCPDIRLYHVNCVPVMHNFSLIKPEQPSGMYPDILIPTILHQTTSGSSVVRCIEDDEHSSLAAYKDSWQQVWFIVNEDGWVMPAGTYTISIELVDITGNKVGESSIILEVLDVELPEQSLYYTNWFHNDCLADFYDLSVFSDEYFAVMKDFMHAAAINGMNMVLLPAFTPPLDTAVGEERMTVQLVGVTKEAGHYSFDFSLMKRYIDVARQAGIHAFEHSHLFTQWGAAHAPKIMAEVDGKTQRIFGWETDAAGEDYQAFLRAYIPAVRAFLRREGLEATTLFHISDEPDDHNFETYQRACAVAQDLLEGCTVGDALDDYKYYESGLVQTPIARTTKASSFIGKCDRLWIYYTGAECYDGLSNRLIQLPRERNRALGWQLYWAKAKGFLHWGYNFYYGRLSHGLYDPALDPCCGWAYAGTSYSVYPGKGKKPLQSIHQKIFADALTDVRALQLLENLAGRAECEKLIREHLGEPDFFNTPDDPESLMNFRKAVNDKIKSYI